MVYLLVAVLFVAAALAISKNLYPYSKLELWALHLMYSHGSGWDDAAFHIMHRHPQRYSPQIKRMLDRAPPGSSDESIALDLVEFVIDQPGIRDALRRMGENHPDQETAKLVSAILDGPPETVTIIEGDGVSAKLVLPESDDE
jgi:hypothetical protein